MSRSVWLGSVLVGVACVAGLGACGEDAVAPSAAADGGADAPAPAACEAPGFVVPGGEECVVPGWTPCPEGFTAGPEGVGCVEVVGESCGAGKMPSLGATACLPVGAPSCPAGASRDASGFGCAAPEIATCTGATRETLGACAPVGDCNAAFPPAGATHFVDDSYTAGQIDATHFTTLAAAVAAAPAGALIAVESGTYAGEVTVTRSLTITGRCAEKVLVSGANGVGLTASGAAATVNVGGVTFSGFGNGALVTTGAKLTLRDAVITGSTDVGVASLGAGTLLGVERSAIRSAGLGARGTTGGALTFVDTAIAGSVETGVSVAGDGTSAVLTRTVVARTRERSAGLAAVGLRADPGTRIEATETVIAGSAGASAYLSGARLSLVSSILSQVTTARAAGGVVVGAGVISSGASDITLDRTTVERTAQGSVQVNGGKLVLRESALIAAGGASGLVGNGTRVDVSKSAVVGASGFALASRSKSTMTLADTFVTGTRPRNGVAYAIIAEQSAIDAKGTSVVDTVGAAVLVFDGARGTFERTLLDRTKAADDSLGFGLLAEKASEVTFRSSAVRRAVSFGLGAKGAKITVENASVREMNEAGDAVSGIGLFATEGSTVTVNGFGVDGAALGGILAGGKGTRVTGAGVSIARTRTGGATGGRGVGAQDGAVVDVERAYLVANAEASATCYDATLVLRRSRVARTQRAGETYGHGALGVRGRLDLDRVALSENPGAAVVFVDATGVVDKSLITQNGIGLSVGGASQLVVAETDPENPAPLEVLVSSDTSLVDNETRVGSGDLPVPPAPKLP